MRSNGESHMSVVSRPWWRVTPFVVRRKKETGPRPKDQTSIRTTAHHLLQARPVTVTLLRPSQWASTHPCCLLSTAIAPSVFIVKYQSTPADPHTLSPDPCWHLLWIVTWLLAACYLRSSSSGASDALVSDQPTNNPTTQVCNPGAHEMDLGKVGKNSALLRLLPPSWQSIENPCSKISPLRHLGTIALQVCTRLGAWSSVYHRNQSTQIAHRYLALVPPVMVASFFDQTNDDIGGKA